MAIQTNILNFQSLLSTGLTQKSFARDKVGELGLECDLKIERVQVPQIT